jgi:uncharacterized protein
MLEACLGHIDKPVGIVLHGGEPLLLGTRRLGEILSVIRRHQDQVRNVFLMTNGTLLAPEWLDLFFQEYKDLGIELAISLDGTAEMNQLRVMPNGEPTFHKVLAAFSLLGSAGKTAGLFSVIGHHALPYARDYVRMLLGIPNLRFVKINPLFDCVPGGLAANSITPAEFSSFLQQVTAEYLNCRGFVKFAIEPILSYLQRIKGVDSKYCNFNQRKCLNFTTLYPDGQMAICDTFSVREFPVTIDPRLGFRRSLDKIADSQAMRPLAEILDDCRACEVSEICNGGCLSQRLYFRRNAPALYGDYCRHRKEMLAFFQQILGAGAAG